MPSRVETGRRCPTVRIMLYWRPFSLFKALVMSARKLLSAALLVLVSPLAMAHAHLTHPVPAADASVAAPAQVSLGFSEAIEVGFSKVTLTTAGGEPVALQALASAVDDRKTLVVKPTAPLAAGQLMSWMTAEAAIALALPPTVKQVDAFTADQSGQLAPSFPAWLPFSRAD